MPSTEKFKITVSQNECVIQLPEEAFLIEGLQLVKRAISADLQKFMPELVEVTFTETFRKPLATSEEKPKEAAPSTGTAAAP
jgi:peptidylprolyl isomerase